MAYFNTTHVRGQQLRAYQEAGEDQENIITLFFQNHPTSEWTPEDLQKYHPWFARTPLTSIRRAFTNLKNSGFIFKTAHQVKGMYGRPIYTWRIMRHGRPIQQQEELL